MTKEEIFYNRMVTNYCGSINQYELRTETIMREGNKVATLYYASFKTFDGIKAIEIVKEEYDCLLEEMKKWELVER